MSSTQYPSPAEVAATLDALTADLIDEPTFKFRKREYGGWYVDHNDLRLGWVVKNSAGNWAIVTYTTRTGLGTVTLDEATSRQQAAIYLAISVCYSHRDEYEIAMEKSYCDEQRYLAIINR